MSVENYPLLKDYVPEISNKSKGKLKLIHMNAQSLISHAKQSEFIDTFLDSDIDIVAVSETWLKDNIQVVIPGYNMFHVNRPEKRIGGGVAIFVKCNLDSKIVTQSTGEEGRPEFVIIEVQAGLNKVLVACLYRPPKIGYLDAFQDAIYNLSVNYKYTFVCGDLNARFGSGSDETKIICDLLSLCNLHCVPYGPTYHTADCNSNLDVICSNCPDMLIDYGQTIASGFSAHDLLFAVYDLPVPYMPKQTITYRDFKNIDMENLNVDLLNAPWQNVYDESDIDSKLEKFNSILLDLMDKHAPLITLTLKKSSQPWMTSEIRSLMKTRDKIRAKYLRTKKPEIKENFKLLRNQVKQKIRNAKAVFYYGKFSTGDSKKLWATVRSLNITSTPSKVEPVISSDKLNCHYASVSSVHYPDQISECIKKYVSQTADRKIDDKFHFKYILPEEIINSVNSIKSNAKGVDQIPIAFLKLCLILLLPVLDHLFNFCLQNSKFPSMWKMANILPIPKVKYPVEPKDYRPISILCVLGKALEKIVHKQVCDYLSLNNMFPQYQSGFRNLHSTSTSLLRVADDIRQAMDSKLITLLVLLDLSKAFDCVHHGLLLSKLKFLGFSDAVVGWFESYLLDRAHRVFVNEQDCSDWAFIDTGVPQGSVLGPLLFILYLIDLPMILSHCKHHSYADDLQLYIHFPLHSFNECLLNMQSDIANVIEYCTSHNLLLNISKTQPIIISTPRFLNKLNSQGVPQLTINNCVVPYFNSVNNLGLIFDSTLSWNDHCIKIAQKVFSTLAQLRRNFSYLPIKVRKLLVTSLVFSNFDYGSVLLTDLSVVNNIRLQRMQNACVRFISGASKFDHVTPIFRDLQILKIENRRTQAVALLIWKIIKTGQPKYLFEQYVFTSVTNSRATRSSRNMLQIPNHRLAKYNKSFLITSIKVWNSLKLYDLQMYSYETVKRKILNLLLSNQT